VIGGMGLRQNGLANDIKWAIVEAKRYLFLRQNFATAPPTLRQPPFGLHFDTDFRDATGLGFRGSCPRLKTFRDATLYGSTVCLLQIDGMIAFDVLLPVAAIVGDRAGCEIDIVPYNPGLP
jgi:hypothetical protein